MAGHGLCTSVARFEAVVDTSAIAISRFGATPVHRKKAAQSSYFPKSYHVCGRGCALIHELFLHYLRRRDVVFSMEVTEIGRHSYKKDPEGDESHPQVLHYCGFERISGVRISFLTHAKNL